MEFQPRNRARRHSLARLRPSAGAALRRGILAGALALAAAAPTTLAAQEGVTIQGRVVDERTRQPIQGVRVELNELDVVLATDASGDFILSDVPLGTYVLTLSAPGYRTASGNFAVLRPGSFVTSLTPLDDRGDAVRGRLVGRVRDATNRSPLQGVRVQIPTLSLDRLTDAEGRFAFSAVPPGRHPVEFSNLGYVTRRDTVEVVADRTTDARVAMAVDPVQLEPLEVTVERREVALERRGFYERRRVIPTGDFVERSDIEQWNPVQAIDIFRRLNGARIRLANANDPLSGAVVLTRNLGGLSGPCYPMVYVDGTIMHLGGSSPAMLNQLVSPDQITGIEVYHGGASMPAEFGGANAACGVIVVWTRS